MPALKLRRGGLGGRLVGQQHLQHLALLGRVEFVLVLVVGGFELIVADLDPGGDVVEPQHRHLEAAPLGRLEGIGVRAIVLVELRIGRLRDGAGGGRRHCGDVGDAALGAQAIERVDQRLRRADPGDQRRGELRLQQILARQGFELLLAHVVGEQDLFVEVAVEGARLVAEGGIGQDRVAHRLVADLEVHAVDLELDQVLAHELLHRQIDDAELLGLLRVDRAAEQAPEALDLALHGLRHLVHGDGAAADARDRGIGRGVVAEDVADAPQAERDDEQTEQDLDDETRGSRSDRLQHAENSRRTARDDRSRIPRQQRAKRRR